jgi:hypothetical protein
LASTRSRGSGRGSRNPLFEPLARGDEIGLFSLPDAVERILQRAERKDRLIVAWSEHELDVVKD